VSVKKTYFFFQSLLITQLVCVRVSIFMHSIVEDSKNTKAKIYTVCVCYKKIVYIKNKYTYQLYEGIPEYFDEDRKKVIPRGYV